MSAPPRFVPAECPTVTHGKTTAVDWANAPTCAVCGEIAALDLDGRCRLCWRATTLLAWALNNLDVLRDAGVDFADEPSPGIVGRHWIKPNPAAVARPRDAVTSAEPPPGSEVAIEPKTP